MSATVSTEGFVCPLLLIRVKKYIVKTKQINVLIGNKM